MDLASARAAAAKILVYNAVTEFPMRRRLLLALAVDLEVTPLAVVLKHETQRQLDRVAAVRDHKPCILKASLSTIGIGLFENRKFDSLWSPMGKCSQVRKRTCDMRT